MGMNLISKHFEALFWYSLFPVKIHSVSATKVVSIRTAARTTAAWIFIFKQLGNDSRCVDKSALTPVDCLSLFVFWSSLSSFSRKSQIYITGNFFS